MSRLPVPTDILGTSYRLLPTEQQLLLLTSVLGTSSKWLTYSLLHDALTSDTPSPAILISFTNEYGYYRDGGRRHGLDLTTQMKKGRFMFIDCFSYLFTNEPPATNKPSATPTSPQRTVIQARAPITAREPGAITPRQPITPINRNIIGGRTSATATSSSTPDIGVSYWSLASASNPADSLARLLNLISNTATSLSSQSDSASPKPRIIIEGIEILLSAGGYEASAIENLIHDIRDLGSTVAIHLPSDSAFLGHPHPGAGGQQPSPLEVAYAALLIGLGHVADAIISLRLLDTGVARDISGVLKVTRGGGNTGSWVKEVGIGVVEEKELLWFEGDSGVKVFKRGSAN